MSKKSARSKGYRSSEKKTKGYTPQEKKTMIIGFAVIALVLIAALVLPEALEARHLLKVKDGVVQNTEDNWLICNVGTSSKKKYRKLAEVNPAEGYELASVEPGFNDPNLSYFKFASTGEAAAQNYTVTPGSGNASELIVKYRQQIGNLADITYMEETIREETVNGSKTYGLVLEYHMEVPAETPEETAGTDAADKPAEETEPEMVDDYTQAAIVYIESPIDGKCVVIQAMNNGQDESVLGDRDALYEVARAAAENVVMGK